MHTQVRFAAVIAGAIALASCGANQVNKEAEETTQAPSRPEIQVSAVSQSPEYEGASLAIKEAKAEKVGSDSAKVNFVFDVKNYELKAQTADNATKLCNNSSGGQHIHFILDNAPYKALYAPENSVTLANGTEHYLMAFLSRSYHESVKSPGAALVYHFKIDDKGQLQQMDVPETPMIFYSRPKGNYLGADTANLLLDYYVWNCTLAPDGYKVKATIKPAGGEPQESASFTFDKWEPKFINNLPMGKSSVTLSLLDKDGNEVNSPANNVTREFELAAGEPMP